MKNSTTSNLLRSLLKSVPLIAVASASLLVSAPTSAQITATKHNLGAASNANRTTDSTEICVFCHTPHGSDTGASRPPLWNKSLTAGTETYTVYSSSTLDSARATDGPGATTSIGSVSMACLSCHDGTQAMDNMINAPGSGGYAAAGTEPLTWAAGGRNTGGVLENGGAFIANLSTDLSNDHPIGIAYCGWTAIVANVPTCSDVDFNGALWNASRSAHYVDTNANSTQQKADLQLYNRTFAAGTGPSVECGSCHDPHSSNNTFLRIANTGSAVCLACHDK